MAANADPNTGYQVCFANSCLLVGGKSKKNFPIFDCIYISVRSFQKKDFVKVAAQGFYKKPFGGK